MSRNRRETEADDLFPLTGDAGCGDGDGCPAGQVLLLACCAPCSGEPLRALCGEGVRPLLYFYNPNIQPRQEYERRRDCMRDYCARLGIEFVEGPYDVQRWLERTAGMEHDPQRGRRCGVCFAMRLEQAAAFTARRGLGVLACTLGISRWKDMDQVNAAGLSAAAGAEGVRYWPRNWRKAGGSQRMYEIARSESFYMQDYCGCLYSRDEQHK